MEYNKIVNGMKRKINFINFFKSVIITLKLKINKGRFNCLHVQPN